MKLELSLVTCFLLASLHFSSAETDEGQCSKIEASQKLNLSYECQEFTNQRENNDCLLRSTKSKLISSVSNLKSQLHSYFSSEKIQSSVQTLSGVFELYETLNNTYNTLSQFLENILKNDTALFSINFDNLKSLENPEISSSTTEIISLVCSMQESISNFSDYHFESEEVILDLKDYTEGVLKNDKEWYEKLIGIYHTEVFWEKEQIENSLNDLLTNQVEHHNLETMKLAHSAIIPYTMKGKYASKCIKISGVTKLQITGKFIKLGGILQNENCSQPYRILEIFSLDKVIIDQDIIKIGEETNVFIFAPNWEVVLKRSFILDGASKNLLDLKAKDGNRTSNKNGADGLAGLPGGPAGNFYGFAETIINEENLKISVNGGNGSDGQNGGNGANGEDGEAPDEEFLENHISKLKCDWDKDFSYYKIMLLKSILYNQYCGVSGIKGYPGGKGGNGGTFGKGSNPGNIKLYTQNMRFSGELSMLNGTDGKFGIGGQSGLGGCKKLMSINIKQKKRLRGMKTSLKVTILDTKRAKCAANGTDGENNVSTTGLKLEKEPIILQSFPQTLNFYKQFILSNIQKSSTYFDLYSTIINNENLQNTYDLLAFVNEYLDLEKHYYKVSIKSQTVNFYKIWQNNLRRYAEHLKNTEVYDKYSMILKYMDLIVEKKIESLTQFSNENLIHQFDKYLDLSLRDFGGYVKTKEIAQVIVLNADFTRNYDLKIEEAQRIIQEDIQKEIDETNSELNGEADLLMTEITGRISIEKNNAKLLEGRLKQIKKKVILKKIISIFNIANAALTYVNPKIGIVGSVISKAASLAIDSIDNSTGKITISSLPNVVKKSFDHYKMLMKQNSEQQKEIVKKTIEQLDQEKSQQKEQGENTEILDKVLDKFKKLLPQKDKVVGKNAVDEMNTIVKSTMDSLKDSVSEKSKNILKKLTFAFKMADVKDITTVFKSINGNPDVLVVNDQIETALKNTVKLQDFKDKISTKFYSIINSIQKTSDISDTVSSASEVYLQFKNFQIEKTFQEFFENIKTFIKEFEVESQFEKTIKNMKVAVKLVLETFGYIQKYVEVRKTENYHMKVRLAGLDVIFTDDAELTLVLAKMTQISTANNILDRYNKLTNNIKSFAFPFINYFMEPESPIKVKDNIYTKTEDAGRKFGIYSLKIKNFEIENSGLPETVVSNFGIDGSAPFYIWDNALYSSEINEVLSGKKVTLFANISDYTKFNAVKFNKIWVKFVSADKEITEVKLQEDMSNFLISINHQGDSFYRCDDRVFVIKTIPCKFMNKQSVQVESNMNAKLRKVRAVDNKSTTLSTDGHVSNILSPYATWTIEPNNVDNYTLELLQKYKSKVHMTLVGSGQYTSKNLKVCKSNLDKYYQEVTNL